MIPCYSVIVCPSLDQPQLRNNEEYKVTDHVCTLTKLAAGRLFCSSVDAVLLIFSLALEYRTPVDYVYKVIDQAFEASYGKLHEPGQLSRNIFLPK